MKETKLQQPLACFSFPLIWTPFKRGVGAEVNGTGVARMMETGRVVFVPTCRLCEQQLSELLRAQFPYLCDNREQLRRPEGLRRHPRNDSYEANSSDFFQLTQGSGVYSSLEEGALCVWSWGQKQDTEPAQ